MTQASLNFPPVAMGRSIGPRFVIGSIGIAILGTLILMAMTSLMTGEARLNYTTPPWALFIHVGTVIPALFLGAPVLLMKKGTPLHKMLGRIWATLMMVTSISSFWLQGMTGGIGPIHIFSVVTLVSIPYAIYCARKGDIASHQRAMMGPYIGLVIAGLFSFLPGRLLGNLAMALFS